MAMQCSKNDETPTAPTDEVSKLSATCKEPTMKSISAQISTINVPFYGDALYLVNQNGEPYVPMKPIVDGMGLTWQSQHEKLKTRFSKGITEIVIPTKGGNQSMTCLAFRKFAGWLHTINVGKVRPELREKVACYQEECDDVLYQYWTKGEVSNPRKKDHQSTATQLTPLRQTAERLITTGMGRIYPDIWKLVHKQFEVKHIHQLTPVQIGEAIEYLNALEGEYLGNANKQMSLPVSFPMSYYDQYRWMRGVDDRALSAPWRYPAGMLVPNGDNPNPLGKMLGELRKMGYEVEGALFQLLSLQHHLEAVRHKISVIERTIR